MKRIILILMIVLMMGPDFHHKDTEDTKNTEVLVIDLSKKLPENPYQEEYQRMLYPTVRIKAGLSTGSGVLIDDYIITAAHVVGDNSEVTVELFTTENTKGTKIEAIVVITDTRKDLALIKPAGLIPYSAHLAPRNYTPYLFTPVWAVGCSLGLPPRPSFGYLCDLGVSAVNNWEISAPILPGNSGGPVYDAKTYEVIGIAVWVHTYKNQIITTMAGIVPINQIYEFLSHHKDTKDTK